MEIFIVMIEDRHSDPQAFPFSTQELALDAARRFLEGIDDVEEQTIDGWLYHAAWGSEGDGIWVVRRELNDSSLEY